jgi:AcrR family transcriptional regulator
MLDLASLLTPTQEARDFPLMPARAARTLSKGELTRRAIIAQALEIACEDGLEALSLGILAAQMRMSKAGVCGRVGSMDALKADVARQYRLYFEACVISPALGDPAGLPRLKALFQHWLRHVTRPQNGGGCLYIRCAAQCRGQPEVWEALREGVLAWRHTLEANIQRAVAAGQLRSDCEPAQLVHEMHGLILVAHHEANFLLDPRSVQRTEAAFGRVIDGWTR